ncbi:unnamed protein product [Calypogeia fissa]
MKRGRQEGERLLSPNEASHISPILVAHSLIEDSLNRCKESDEVTRITVSVTLLPINTDDRSIEKSRFSVADTGYGIHPQQVSKYFPYRICSIGTSSADHYRNLSWDGVLFVTTTGIEEPDIRSYNIHEIGSGATQGRTGGHRISSTESKSKAGSTFSGTEASVLLIGDTSDLEIYIRNLCRKGVLIEFCVQGSRQQNSNYDRHEENCELISDGGVELPESLSDLDRLGIGMIEYTGKHIYKYQEASSDEQRLKQALQVGKGQSVQQAQWKMQACFILIQKDRDELERIMTGTGESIETLETQVVCFEDFQYRPVKPAYALRAIDRVDWSTFGLDVKRVDIRTCGGFPSMRALPEQKATWKGEMKMAKSAIEAALQDLRESLPHLLSNRLDVQVQKYIPALARCISGLITSSANADFRAECEDIVGLSPEDYGGMEEFLSSKMLQIVVQRTRRGLPLAAGNVEDVCEKALLSEPSQEPSQEEQEEEETACGKIWDFW